MAYNRRGYFRRARAIQKLAAEFYEPGRQDRCYKWVWKKHVEPRYGCCYHTFLKYLKAKEPPQTDDQSQLKLF